MKSEIAYITPPLPTRFQKEKGECLESMSGEEQISISEIVME